MAINVETTQISLKLKKETASRCTTFERVVTDDQAGTVTVTFPASVAVQEVTYEVDANGKDTAVYETRDLGTFAISQEELMPLWGIPIVRADNGQSGAFGELFSALIDQMIAAKLAPPPPVVVVGP